MTVVTVFCVVLAGFLYVNGYRHRNPRGHVRDLIDNCGCYDSTCSCCTNTYVTEGARQESAVCVYLAFNANDLNLNVDFQVNGASVYSTTIDPSSFPVCYPAQQVPVPSLCLAANKVHLGNRNALVCTTFQVKGVLLTLYNYKLPCITYSNGQVVISRNNY